MRIANRTDRRINAGRDEPFGEPDRRILAPRVIVMNKSRKVLDTLTWGKREP